MSSRILIFAHCGRSLLKTIFSASPALPATRVMNFTVFATTESASPATGTTLRIERPAPTNSP